MSNDKVPATFHPDDKPKRTLPSLDFWKPVGHDGDHLPVRNPAIQHFEPDDAPIPHAHLDEH